VLSKKAKKDGKEKEEKFQNAKKKKKKKKKKEKERSAEVNRNGRVKNTKSKRGWGGTSENCRQRGQKNLVHRRGVQNTKGKGGPIFREEGNHAQA